MITLDPAKIKRRADSQAEALADAKGAARARLSAHIDAARRSLITPLTGQDMIYLAKEAEALAWVGAEDPALADYPLLAAEIGITAPDADQLAQLWLNMAAIWRQTAAQLEAWRLSAGAAVDMAETPEDAWAAITQPMGLPHG